MFNWSTHHRILWDDCEHEPSPFPPPPALPALPFCAAATLSSRMMETGTVSPVWTARKACTTAIPTSCAFWKTWTAEEGHRRDLVGTSRMTSCSEYCRYRSRSMMTKKGLMQVGKINLSLPVWWGQPYQCTLLQPYQCALLGSHTSAPYCSHTSAPYCSIL